VVNRRVFASLFKVNFLRDWWILTIYSPNAMTCPNTDILAYLKVILQHYLRFFIKFSCFVKKNRQNKLKTGSFGKKQANLN
jgi:hypothetical protein